MEAYIFFEADIDAKNSALFARALTKLSEIEEVSKINIFLSSVGGSIYYGFAIATIIQNSKTPIAIHATNQIDSIANVIFMSAKERTAESCAKFYMHGALVSGRFYKEDLMEELQSIETQNDRIAKFISENTAWSVEDVKNRMQNRETMGAAKALELGVVSQVIHKTIPKDAIRYDIVSLE